MTKLQALKQAYDEYKAERASLEQHFLQALSTAHARYKTHPTLGAAEEHAKAYSAWEEFRQLTIEVDFGKV